MLSRSTTLIAGIAAGILMMLVVDQPQRSSDETTTMVTIPSQADELANAIRAEPPERNHANDNPRDVVERVPPTDDRIGIPDVYRRVIGPIRPRAPSFAERHAAFEIEPIDTAWAYAMETGINDHIAMLGAGEGVVIEYVECRSQYCEVGGYAIEGYEADFSATWGDMVQSEWWQASGRYKGRGGGEAPGYFLAIIPRYDSQGR